MARILVSFPSMIHDKGQFQLVAFYESFLKSLAQFDNEILVLNSAEYLSKPWNGNNNLSIGYNKHKLSTDIRAFDPELILAFNHSIPRIVLEITTCPVAVWDADSIPYYNDKDYIRAHQDRYYFLCFSMRGVDSARQFGVEEERIAHVTAGTGVQAQPRSFTQNISFIGTGFSMPPAFTALLKARGPAAAHAAIDAIATDFYGDHTKTLKDHNAEWVADYIDPMVLGSINAVQNRTMILSELQELGLALYGCSAWYDTARFLPRLAMAYRPEKVYSLQHNQDIYNSSKICINISHTQTIDGVPWRVLDIMASNGCLVSDKRSSIAEFARGYVEIPMYENRRDAYDLCQRVLGDNQWREDIVAGSQQYINDHGRWEPRIAAIAAFTGCNLAHTKAVAEDIDVSHLHSLVIKSKNHRSWYSAAMDVLVSFALKFTFLRMLGRILYKMGMPIPYRYSK